MAKYVKEIRMAMIQIHRKVKEVTMQFEGALIKEQGVTFAIVIVKSHVLNSETDRQNARVSFRRFFPGMPIILMAQNSRGVPTYQGRSDIVEYLSRIEMSRIPWQSYTAN